MTENILIKFEGQLAEQHRLPAYEASQSLYGISRALLISMNYLDEGRVRRREFNPRGFQINIVAQRPGSFETLYEIVTNPEIWAITKQVGVGVTGALLKDFLQTIFRRSIGKPGTPIIEKMEADGALNPGDLS